MAYIDVTPELFGQATLVGQDLGPSTLLGAIEEAFYLPWPVVGIAPHGQYLRLRVDAAEYGADDCLLLRYRRDDSGGPVLDGVEVLKGV